ncbi:MAG: GNAT family N-acetyltransferase [Candidatus Pacebacteria bacterium]|nr:GNAT family N-acetyltransferase [Candidatus Paceibacterota bacterium]
MYTLRLIEEKDLPSLSKALSKSFTQADPEKPWDEGHSYENLKYWIKKQPDLFYVAIGEDGTPLGGMVVNIKPWRTDIRCNDGMLFVDPSSQSRGIGKDLFKKVIERALHKYNAETFEGITFAGKEFPMSWYEKIGIEKDEYAMVIVGKCKDILEKFEV